MLNVSSECFFKGLKISPFKQEKLMAELGSLTLVANLYIDRVSIKYWLAVPKCDEKRSSERIPCQLWQAFCR